MCGRFALIAEKDDIEALLALLDLEAFPPRYNIAPTQPVPIVRMGANGARELALVRWGLIPSWVKDPREFTTLMNARSESVAQQV